MKAPLILVVSDLMDGNKKKDRYEDKLIRMGEKARHNLGLKDEKNVELWPDGDSRDRISRSRVLEIFKAYSRDLKEAKSKMSEEDFNRIGFVTSRTFSFICKDGRKKKEDIWLADTIEDTVIGADPEFLLLREDGTIKYAAEVQGFARSDELGSDGPCAEIRPKPEVSVNDFVANIEDILRNHRNTKLIDKYKWQGGCFYHGAQQGGSERDWPIGGHIHIGTPARMARAIDSFGDLYKTALYSCLNKILDEYVSLAMIRLDGKEIAIKRRKSFGYYGDFRTDHGRLEYRSLSGEWLTHPKLALVTAGAVKAVSHAFFKMLDEAGYKHSMIMTDYQQGSNDHSDFYFFDKKFSHWKNIEITRAFNAIVTSDRMHQVLTEGKMEFRKTFFTNLKKKFRSLSTYKEYSEIIDGFLEIVSLPGDVLNKERDKDLKHAWVEGVEFII